MDRYIELLIDFFHGFHELATPASLILPIIIQLILIVFVVVIGFIGIIIAGASLVTLAKLGLVSVRTLIVVVITKYRAISIELVQAIVGKSGR